MYQWGRKVTWTGQQTASQETEFQIGEYGRMTNFDLTSEWSLNPIYKSPEEITAELAAKLKLEHNAELVFISMDTHIEISGDHSRQYTQIHELIFKGSPIAPMVIIAIIAVIGLAILIAAPVIWKLSGVSVGDIIGYSIGPLLIIGGAIVAVVVIGPAIMDALKGKNGGRKRARAR